MATSAPIAVTHSQCNCWAASDIPCFGATIFGLGLGSGHYPAALFGVLTVVFTVCFHQSLDWRQASGRTQCPDPRSQSLAYLHLSHGLWGGDGDFFQLAFIYSLHQLLKRQDWRFAVPMLLSLFFAFYSYHGSKLTMLFVGAASIFFIWWQRRLHTHFKLIASALLVLSLGLLAGSDLVSPSPGPTWRA